MMIPDFGILVSLLVTLIFLSYAFKLTLLYRITERIFLGVTFGSTVSAALYVIYKIGLLQAIAGEWIRLVPMMLGVLLLLQVRSKWVYISRWPFAILVGSSFGLVFRSSINAEFVRQIYSTILPITTGNLHTNISNLILIIGTISTLMYFLFSYEHKGPVLDTINKIGRIFLLISFGAAFGNYLMARQSLLYSRIVFVVETIKAILLG